MKATYHPGVHKFALFVFAWATVLLTAGALVTSEDAALAVPDWPLSYGTLNPPMVGGIAFEHSHRLIAAALGLLVIILASLLWRYDERPSVRYLGLVAVGGVIFQGILGGLTVLKLLHYWLPVMHACTAQLVFVILVSIAFFTSRWWMQDLPQYEDRGSPSIHAGSRNLARPRLASLHRRPANPSWNRRSVDAHRFRRRSPADAARGRRHGRPHRRRCAPLCRFHRYRAFVLSSCAAQKG